MVVAKRFGVFGSLLQCCEFDFQQCVVSERDSSLFHIIAVFSAGKSELYLYFKGSSFTIFCVFLNFTENYSNPYMPQNNFTVFRLNVTVRFCNLEWKDSMQLLAMDIYNLLSISYTQSDTSQ